MEKEEAALTLILTLTRIDRLKWRKRRLQPLLTLATQRRIMRRVELNFTTSSLLTLSLTNGSRRDILITSLNSNLDL